MTSLNNNFVKSITNTFPDELSDLPELSTPTIDSDNGWFSNISWQTWVIIILIFALLGINVFAYLAKGTQDITTFLNDIFGPILKLFGYTTLETTKQVVKNTATGTTAGVNTLENTSVGAIDKAEQVVGTPQATSGTSVGVSISQPAIKGQMAASSQSGAPVLSESELDQKEAALEQRQQDSLEKALSNAAQTSQVKPDDSISSIQTTGKAGWCFIGDDLGVRTCSQVGVNDTCMSGDIFPSQEICMNPNLRP
jgi:hypothetical protein